MTTDKNLSMAEKFKLLQEQRVQEAAKVQAGRKTEIVDREQYDDVDHIINKVIEELWDEFDDDGNGTLDYDETKDFVKTTLVEMGEKPDYTEQDFLECFTYFLPQGAQVITKLEMRIFVKKIAGLDTREDEAADKAEKEAALE
jgi:Ca2+-binding EF-hand superfamily protein